LTKVGGNLLTGGPSAQKFEGDPSPPVLRLCIVFPFLVISAALTPGMIITGLSGQYFVISWRLEAEDWPAQTIPA